MDTPSFATLMQQERTRLQEAIKAAKAKRQDVDREIIQLQAQSAAIDAYDAALKGKAPPKEPGAPRGRRGEKREALRHLIAQHPEGVTRGQILTEMQAHGDKNAEMSISNALAALKKARRVVQEGKTYKVRE